ncbi:Ig-like domain-containing protein [Clostridium fungisolvens]|uniref:Mannosyl-glycoprotein endo-beta-N-acetylglucosamidase-like domain-containing protein n=1 Tax=Clostridium fungisolvens TaxID=1604897 RepID=A0A6V8SAI7_9CLOT|nr:Ig-like domain-containing protein [Clostridium fungisolvens]GFP74264.1 hypothetical protein bsdtw1_00309 [Clostridium fungisolvens]
MNKVIKRFFASVVVFAFFITTLPSVNAFAESTSSLLPMTTIESPVDNGATQGQLNISGWAINASGVKEIQVFLDDSYIGDASINYTRNDIGQTYPQYANSSKSGYVFKYDVSSITAGKHKVTVKSIGNDNSVDIPGRYIYINMPNNDPKSSIESIYNGQVINDSINISGWALNSSSVKNVKVYIDWKYVGDATIGYYRSDIYNSFKDQYPGADNSGYTYSYDAKKLSQGKHVIMIQPIGYDGTIDNNEGTNIRYIYTNMPTLQPASYLEEPANNYSTEGNIKVNGWAVNSSTIKEVKVYVDWKYHGSAKIGGQRNDIGQALSNYPEAFNSGFSYEIDSRFLAPGTHSIMVQPIGYDGTIDQNEKATIRNVNIVKKYAPYTIIEAPANNDVVKTGVNLSGWAINQSGVKQVNIYLDGTLKGNANIGFNRSDVGNKFTQYYDSVHSGYSYYLSLDNQSKGNHVVTVEAVGFDGTKKSTTVIINLFGIINYTNTNKTLDAVVLQQIIDGSPVKYDSSVSDWVPASADDVKYYMNPNNFQNSDQGIYQFLKLSYMDGISADDLNNILKGKGILEGKGSVFIEAGKANNINPIYLVSHALLETGNGSSKLANGIYVNQLHSEAGNVNSDLTNVEGKTVYNMFGIGAYDSNANLWGSERAYKEGWFSVDSAIMGGAKFIGTSYINSSYKQDTIYKMRWNTNYVPHQYATDIAWANSQCYNIKKLVDQCNNSKIYFEIPVYN